MNMIDVILSRIGKDDDGLGPNWSATERIVHKFHMYDVWSRVLITYKKTVLKDHPQVNIDFTLASKQYNHTSQPISSRMNDTVSA